MLIGEIINFYTYPHVTRDWRDKRDKIKTLATKTRVQYLLLNHL